MKRGHEGSCNHVKEFKMYPEEGESHGKGYSWKYGELIEENLT